MKPSPSKIMFWCALVTIVIVDLQGASTYEVAAMTVAMMLTVLTIHQIFEKE